MLPLCSLLLLSSLIEDTMGEAAIVQDYQGFLAGRFTLPASEVYQFGFRLASRSGNATIYPIDTWGPSIYDDTSASGKRIDTYLTANFKKIDDPVFDRYLARSDTLERNGTYLDLLRYLNTDAAIRANASSYSVLAGMGRSADNAGAAYVAHSASFARAIVSSSSSVRAMNTCCAGSSGSIRIC